MQPVKKNNTWFGKKQEDLPEPPRPAYTPAEQEYIRTLNDIRDSLLDINQHLGAMAQVSVLTYQQEHNLPEVEEPEPDFEQSVAEAVKRVMAEQTKKANKK